MPDVYGNGVIGFALTNVCNLHCRMCGSQLSVGVDRIFADEKVWRAAVSFMPKNWTIEINSLGEHTLHPQFLDMLRLMADERPDLRLYLTTNGHWPFPVEAFVDIVHRLLPRSASIINFSIDGSREETYQRIRGKPLAPVLDTVRSCIARREKNKIEFGVSFVAMRNNMAEAQELIAALPGLSAFYFNVLHTVTADMLPESLYGMRDEYTRVANATAEFCRAAVPKISFASAIPQSGAVAPGCSFPWNLWIDPQGRIFPCCRRFDQVLGDITRDSYATVSAQSARIQKMLGEDSCRPCFATQEAWDWRQHFASRALFDEWTARYAKSQ